jgi:hypothetical protein
VVLLVAAGLKCHQLATEPILEKTWLDARWLLMLTVEFELFFGIWLLSNNLPRLTWLAALGCFSTFTCISLWKALSGYASCGCFGTVHVNPWYTSTLDFSFVISLLIWRPRFLLSPASEGRAKGESRWCRGLFLGIFGRAIVVLFTWLAIGLPAAYAMGHYADTILSNVGTIVGDGKIVVLEPEKWGGKRFPLLPYIEDAPNQMRTDERPLRERLTEGEWLVMLYHHDCPKCQAAVQDLPKAAQAAGVQQIALIAMPPDENRDEVASRLQNSMKGRLDSNRNWFAETPIIVTLQDAKILGVEVQQ